MDNSSLTGESEGVSLEPSATHRDVMESRNLAFFSTSVVEGTGRGVVLHTGDRTLIGNIAHIVSGIKQGQTPIKKGGEKNGLNGGNFALFLVPYGRYLSFHYL